MNSFYIALALIDVALFMCVVVLPRRNPRR